MNKCDRYCGIFSKEQVNIVEEILQLETHQQAFDACTSIMGGLFQYSLIAEQKERIGPTTEAKRKLAQISSAARKLANLLADESLCRWPDKDLETAFDSIVELAPLKKTPLWRDKNVNLDKFRSLLDDLSDSTHALSQNDKMFRGYYFLPPIDDATKHVETSALWPWLFIMWEQHGRTVAATINGPLHRFIQLVHEAAGLRTPEGEALRGAVQAWKSNPRRSDPKNEAWCYATRK